VGGAQTAIYNVGTGSFRLQLAPEKPTAIFVV
jgi:hypothetical protein